MNTSVKALSWYTISMSGSIAVGIFLLILGGYSTIAAFTQTDAFETMRKIKSGQEVQTDELTKAIASQRRTILFSRQSSAFMDLGLAELSLAKQYGYFTVAGKDLLFSSLAHTERGLTLSPAYSAGWIRLAYIRLLLEGVTKNISNAVYMSVVTSPYDPGMLYYRLSLAIIAWDYFSDEEKDIILQQVRIGWSWDNKKIMEMMKSPKAKNILTRALQHSAADSRNQQSSHQK